MMMKGLESELAALRGFDLKKRLREMSFFVAFWAVSIVINFLGLQLSGALPMLLRIAGTIGTAVATWLAVLFVTLLQRRVTRRLPWIGFALLFAAELAALAQQPGPDLSIDVNSGRHQISPDIYGINFYWDLGIMFLGSPARPLSS